MASFRHSVVFRMTAGYGLLLLISVALISTVFYVGTAGLLARNIDKQLTSISRHLIQVRQQEGPQALERDIHALLTDNQDVDTEVYLLIDPSGRKIAGNLTAWPTLPTANDQLVKQQVKRLGRDSISRLLSYRFQDGTTLVVGRDLQDQHDLERMVLVALSLGGVMALVLAAAGAWLFRAQLQKQLMAIHRTTTEIAAGHLDRRIEVGKSQDEFAIVAHDVNIMLEEIERLMDTARDVSNAIAHDLRTPLGRIRGSLEDALRPHHPADKLPYSAQYAIDEIDALIVVFDKLLQIAEAESGVRRQPFDQLPLREVASDLVELYQPAAENQGVALSLLVEGEPVVNADRDLIAGVLANLLDNALKYAGHGAQVQVRIECDPAQGRPPEARIVVRDYGPGIPADALERATERFFRADTSRSLRGNGLGLSIVAASVALHRGRLTLENAHPGLRVTIALPACRLG
ncbi:sensor histidine kinase [Dyella tabacisoli]|uniref:histidine kinase n=1 Tax=Dyella tabacisoli TaxID=2282381 RepID=A0A369URV2_9GAMM|nr:HAMP domain-containing sensor histidine kinase [Dyella tabacisoli]RDD83396.1 sensor histidine kinase [Dyella tabacisoli]